MNSIASLCDELDLTVLSDFQLVDENAQLQEVFAVGCSADRDAGIHGFVITPWITSKQALDAYCSANYARIIEEGAPEC